MSATFGLSEAMSFYAGIGYEFVRVPWTVPFRTINKTYEGKSDNVPAWFNTMMDEHEIVVGSAEQGFLHIYNELVPGKKYMSLTPCMRHEDHYDPQMHLRGFMKLELFVPDQHVAGMILNHADRFFSTWMDTRTVKTDKGFDLVNAATRVELGSYYNVMGDPKKDIPPYSCGTGIAWERFLYAMGQPQTNLWEKP